MPPLRTSASQLLPGTRAVGAWRAVRRLPTAAALQRAPAPRLHVAFAQQLRQPVRLRGAAAAAPLLPGAALAAAPRRARHRPAGARQRRLCSTCAVLNPVADLGMDSLTFLAGALSSGPVAHPTRRAGGPGPRPARAPAAPPTADVEGRAASRAAVVVVVPLFKRFNVSPVLGFLLAGVALDRFHLFREEENVARLAELGVLFLLFEQGLELTVDRLKALAKYAFVLGVLQVTASTLAFTAMELPVGTSLGSTLLENWFHADPNLVSIRSVDEAVVIGAALSLSSSAFVLQLLAERGELGTPYGQATLGVLLLQDIAVVPLLVILPLYEQGVGGAAADALAGGVAASGSLLAAAAPAAAKAALGLGLIVLGGRVVLRRVFDVVAGSRANEAFVALCLLTVVGTGLATQRLGFSDSLGAFLAGVLLAETNYRSQIEADIRPFRGLLLGLFFVTTGTSIDLDILAREWPNVLALVAGLVAVKTAIVAAGGPLVGLSRAESVRTGLLLGQGGEFAFVLFSLANQLEVLPADLNKLLIIVVVASMALTPALAEAGRLAYTWVEEWEGGSATARASAGALHAGAGGENKNKIVICGFSQHGQTLANMLRTAAEQRGGGSALPSYVAFDLDPDRVAMGRSAGFNVVFGDAARPEVLHAAGVHEPLAVAVAYARPERVLQAVRAVRSAFGPHLSVIARARDTAHGNALVAAGATHVVVDSFEAGLLLGSALLRDLGLPDADNSALAAAMRAAMQTAEGVAPPPLPLASDLDNVARAAVEAAEERREAEVEAAAAAAESAAAAADSAAATAAVVAAAVADVAPSSAAAAEESSGSVVGAGSSRNN